jgi:hypothetical protein
MGKSLSSGCDEIIATIFTILDIVCAIFISIMLKEIIVFLYSKYFKNQDVKAETTIKDKIKISIASFLLIAYLILIIINTIAYLITPKFILF